jgi:hypothetical protein
MFDEPILISKIDDHILNLSQSDNQALEKIFVLKDIGMLITSAHSN